MGATIKITEGIVSPRQIGANADAHAKAGPLANEWKSTVTAVLIGDRLDTSGIAAERVLSTNPLTIKAGTNGMATLFRYGVTVMIGLTPPEEQDFIQSLEPRIRRQTTMRDEETATIEVSTDGDDQIAPGGAIIVKAFALERLLVIADALAKSVVLARDEREVATVFDIMEPFARKLAREGRTPGGRRAMLRQIGTALLVQHRVSGHAAVAEKPDVLWDRPELERLYARLEDEYELKERAALLDRKLAVITDTAQALTDVIDTERSLRLEVVIVLLIMFEIVITFYEMFSAR